MASSLKILKPTWSQVIRLWVALNSRQILWGSVFSVPFLLGWGLFFSWVSLENVSLVSKLAVLGLILLTAVLAGLVISGLVLTQVLGKEFFGYKWTVLASKTNREIPRGLNILLRVWWALTWRDLAASLVSELLGALVGGLIGLSFGFLGVPGYFIEIFSAILALVLDIVISWLPVRMVIDKNFGDFRLALVQIPKMKRSQAHGRNRSADRASARTHGTRGRGK